MLMSHTATARQDGAPAISVVMSCFNDQRYVADSIASIQRQSCQDWQMILINDGSTDGTGDILDRFAADDSRIHVIHQVNQGLTRSLITGCRAATGTYIARQDTDDLSLPDRLTLQMAVLEQQDDIGFVSSHADLIGPENEFLSTVTRPADPVTATQALLEHRLGPSAHGSVMFRKSVYDAVGGYRPEFYYAQDSDLWLRMAEVSRIAYVQQSCYQLRWHPSSITGSGRSTQKEFGQLGHLCRAARLQGGSQQPILDRASALTQQIRNRSNGHSQIGRTTQKDQTAVVYSIGSQLSMNGDIRARSYLWRVIVRQPWHWKAWFRLGQSFVSHKQSATRCGISEDHHDAGPDA